MTTLISRNSVYSNNSFFSLNRFGAYFKYYIASNAKKLLLCAGIVLVATFAMQLLIFYAEANYSYTDSYSVIMDPTAHPVTDNLWSTRCGLYQFLMMFIMIIAGSMMFSEMAQRPNRLMTLELPASQCEKFLTWFGIYLPAALVITWSCFWLVDAMLVGWGCLFTPFGPKMKILNPLQIITFSKSWDGDTNSIVTLTSYYSIMAIINSLFALGSIFFHRLALLKTSIALFIFGCLTSVTGFISITLFRPNPADQIVNFDENPINEAILIAVVSTIVCILIYWLCYARLKQEEVIARW